MTKAYIDEQIDEYTYKVRMVFYNKSDSSAYKTLQEQLEIATVCILPGAIPTYEVGDVVFVEFEDDQMGKPVIMGRLLCEKQQSYSDFVINSLKVNNDTTLSIDTTIGNVQPTGIEKLSEDSGEIANQFLVIQEQIDSIGQSGSHIGMIIYSSTLDTESKVIALYGGTHWEKIEGKFLLGVSSTHSAGSTGGSETHTPSGTVGDHTLTISEMPSHLHELNFEYGADDNNHAGSTIQSGDTAGSYIATVNGLAQWGLRSGTRVIETTGGGGAHNHSFTGSDTNTMPPYKTVYIWERIS